jgi:hypothetical protein
MVNKRRSTWSRDGIVFFSLPDAWHEMEGQVERDGYIDGGGECQPEREAADDNLSLVHVAPGDL